MSMFNKHEDGQRNPDFEKRTKAPSPITPIPLAEINHDTREVYGQLNFPVEVDYESAKKSMVRLTDDYRAASDGVNICTLRKSHSLEAIGAGKTILFGDSVKMIWMRFRIIDEAAWNMIAKGVLNALEAGGDFIGSAVHVLEVSLVAVECGFASAIMPPVTVRIPMPSGAAEPKKES